MHQTMASRTRRGSTKNIILPNPLVLKHEQRHLHANLNTPPPTGLPGQGLEAYKLQRSTLSTPISAQMPYTPRSPLQTACLPAQFKMAHTTQTPDREYDLPATTMDREAASRSQTPVANERTKRGLDKDETHEDRPTKHRVSENNLIHNTFYELIQVGVSMLYVRSKIVEAASGLFEDHNGASVFVRGVPLSKPGAFAVRVIPRRSGVAPFRICFNTEGPRQRRAQSVPCEDRKRSDVADATRKRDEAIAAMPLHLEVAVLRLPILGQLLLSGHIFKGDFLEIELSEPDVLYDVLRWAYTNKIGAAARCKTESCIKLFHGTTKDNDM